MFRAMTVDSSVLLLSCFITTGASGSCSLLLIMLYDNINIAHNHRTNNVIYLYISTSTMLTGPA